MRNQNMNKNTTKEQAAHEGCFYRFVKVFISEGRRDERLYPTEKSAFLFLHNVI